MQRAAIRSTSFGSEARAKKAAARIRAWSHRSIRCADQVTLRNVMLGHLSPVSRHAGLCEALAKSATSPAGGSISNRLGEPQVQASPLNCFKRRNALYGMRGNGERHVAFQQDV